MIGFVIGLILGRVRNDRDAYAGVMRSFFILHTLLAVAFAIAGTITGVPDFFALAAIFSVLPSISLVAQAIDRLRQSL